MSAFQVGATLSTTRVVTQEQINAYAAASGDHNPLHTDPAFAAATPLRGTIAHGMLVLAWLSALLTETFDRDWLERGALRIRFRAPARPGDVLTISATVRASRPGDNPSSVVLDLRVINQRQEAVIDGQGWVGKT